MKQLYQQKQAVDTEITKLQKLIEQQPVINELNTEATEDIDKANQIKRRTRAERMRAESQEKYLTRVLAARKNYESSKNNKSKLDQSNTSQMKSPPKQEQVKSPDKKDDLKSHIKTIMQEIS